VATWDADFGWHGTCKKDRGVRAAVSLLTLAFFAPVAAGCISNEYVIPNEELNRLVSTPPELRGQHVHVVQDLGSRRTDPIPADNTNFAQVGEPWPPPAVTQDETPPAAETRDTDAELDLRIDGNIDVGGGGGQRGAGRPGGWRGAPGGGGSASTSGGGWQGKPPSGGGVAWRGTPTSGGGGGWHGVPPASSGGGSSGGSWLGGSSSGGGGGGNGGDAMIVLAVVLAAVAVVMAVGLVSSEGVRFDGLADMSPWQPVHLKQRAGDDLVIALGDLKPIALRDTVEAKVMDDEGYGIRRLGHLPISRDWTPTFKLDGGSMMFTRNGGASLSGIVANMQFGVFVRPWLGFLLTAGVGGAGDQYGATLTRHNFGFEVQSLPLALGPLRVGGFGNVGAAAIASTASGSGAAEWGREVGGGLLTELELTGRLALTFRAGANEAFFADSGTVSPAATFTGGIAIY